MVTLEARAMTETSDAFSWKGFKLSRTHRARTQTNHKELKTRETTQANEDRDEDQRDKMGQRNNTRLRCQ